MPEMGQRYETDDLTIAAALLQCNGAAWDGRESLTFNVKAENLVGRKQLVVNVMDTRCDVIDKPVSKPFTDHSTGKFYPPGSTAPMQRVVFVLEGAYRTYRASAKFDAPFTDDDWRRWVREFHRDGGMLRMLKGMTAAENILRNMMRDRHGIASKFQMRVQG